MHSKYKMKYVMENDTVEFRLSEHIGNKAVRTTGEFR